MFDIMNLVQRVIHLIKKRPLLFVGLLLVKLLFLSLMIGGTGIFQVKILQDVQNIIEPLQDANIDLVELQQGKPFLENVGMMEQGLQSLKTHALSWVGFIFLIVITINWVVWTGSHYLFGRKKLAHFWIKYTSATILIGGVIIGILWFSITRLMDGINTSIYLIIGLFILLYYIFTSVVAASHVHSWKLFLRHVYKILIHPRSIILFIIAQGLIAFLLYAFFVSVNISVVIPIILFIIIVLLMVLFKLTWLAHAESIQ